MAIFIHETDLVSLCKSHDQFLTRAYEALQYQDFDQALYFLEEAHALARKFLPREDLRRRELSGFYGGEYVH